MIEVHAISKAYMPSGGLLTYLLSKQHSTVKALNNVSLFAQSGQITAILGPNGAGKTTLLRILSGLEQADSGHCTIDGQTIHQQRARFSYLSDGSGLYRRLTGRENIKYQGQLYGMSAEAIQLRLEFLDAHLHIANILDRRIETCSLGERMRISLARALIHDPHTLILDEPTNGLDLSSVRQLRQYLRFLASAQGGQKCIVLCSHHLYEVEQLAHQVWILADGMIRASGSVESIVEASGCCTFEDAFALLAFGYET